MKIIRNGNELVNLYELKAGSLFVIYPNGSVFILTNDKRDNDLFVVELQTGDGYCISKETKVIEVEGTLYIGEKKNNDTNN